MNWLIGGGASIIVLSMIVVIVAILIAVTKKRIDDAQERIGEVGGVLEHKLHLTGLKPVFSKLSSGSLIGAIAHAKAFAKEWLTTGKIDDLIANIIVKGLRGIVDNFPEHLGRIAKAFADCLPKIMENKEAAAVLEPVFAERALGFILDDEAQADLGRSVPVLAKFGSKELTAFVSALNANKPQQARKAFQEFVALLRDEDRIDDILMDRAKTAVPELLKDPLHAPVLRELVNGPPSIEQQIADLQKKQAAQKAAASA